MPEVKTFGISAVRELARVRVSETSLRAVAEEIGMSFSGLRSFLDGTEPYPATVKKLIAWYGLARQGKSPKRPAKAVVPRAEVDAAIEVLESYLLAADGDRDFERRKQRLFDRLLGKSHGSSMASTRSDRNE